MKKTNKLISILLLLAMLLSMAPIAVFTASAAESDFTLNNGRITGYRGSDEEVVIPSAIGGKTVTAIGSSAFRNNTRIVSVVIPATVTKIENSAFQDCSRLETVTIMGNLNSIGLKAFYGCNLTLINYYGDVSPSSIGGNDFSNVVVYTVKGTDITFGGVTVKDVLDPLPAGTVYAVTVDSTITNGTVKTDKNEAAEGTEVTIIVTPDTGYALEALTVTDANNGTVNVTNHKFIMPAKAVTVSASFFACEHDYDENGKCSKCETQAAAKVVDKDGNELEGSPYNSLAKAVEAVENNKNCTLTLLDDITLIETLDIDESFTIDLNSKTLNCTSGDTIYIDTINGYAITLEDSSENKTGVIKSETGSAIDVSAGSKFILNSGTVSARNDYAISSSYRANNHSMLEVNGGTVDGQVICFADSVITGGTFNDMFCVSFVYKSNKFSGGIFNGGIKINSSGSLNDVLADGYHFRNAEGGITDGSSNIIKEKITIEKGADLSEADITLDQTEFTYTGEEIRPNVIVKVGGKTLTEGKDYTLAFANNINVGTATVKVKGTGQAAGGIAGGGENIGNSSNTGDITESVYSGEVTKEFTINKKPVTATATAPDKVYDGTVNLDFSKVVITFDGIADGDDVSYEIMGGAYLSSNVAEKVRVGVSYDVSGRDVSNYEFSYGAAIPEAKYYSVMTFASILAKDISDGFIILGDALTYNGTEQTQTVEKVLPSGTAPEATYTVSGNKATNVGVYLLTVTGTGNFTGEAKITFEIAVDMNGVDFDQLHPLNVKATDKEKIEYIYNQLDNASRDYADAEKCNEWDNNKSYCVELLKMIESVADKLEGFKNKLAVYDIDTVTSDDADDLDCFYNDEVAKVYNDYFDNLTEEQTKELDNILLGISALQKRISDVAKEITRITNAVNGYDKATVKSSNKADLEQLVADIKALTDATNINEAERAKLEALDEKVDALIKKIDDTKAEIDRVNDAVAGYDEETVMSSDKADLEQLKEDIQALIDSTNTTESEKTSFEEMIEKVEALEDKIEETEQQLEDIAGVENGYNPETVTSDDKSAIEEAIAEIEAINPDNLTDEQKAEYEEIKAGFEALLEEIAAAEKAVEDIGVELKMFDEKRVTKFWEDDIEALEAKIDELLADGNMGEAEKAKLNEYKSQCDKLIEIINTPVKYFSLRFFYLIWDCLVWKFNGILRLFSKIFGC